MGEIHNESGYKEVYFDVYCSECEHEGLKDVESPCNECLENPINLHSHKPTNFKEKE